MIKIKKNILTKSSFKKLNDIMASNYFPWYEKDMINPFDKTGYGYFTHYLYLENKINSAFYEEIIPEFLKKLKVKKLIRARLNLYPKTMKTVEHAYHVDYKFNHTSAVFFVNDNNGYLFLKKPFKKIKPEGNKIVVFDGHHEHASSSCTDRISRIVSKGEKYLASIQVS